MIKNSKAWAEARGLLWKSEIHGCDEWKCPTMKEFELLTKNGQMITQSGSMAVEDLFWEPINPIGLEAL